ncbi:hypothetical protein WME91_46175 [Sorangium sp. So ce269]
MRAARKSRQKSSAVRCSSTRVRAIPRTTVSVLGAATLGGSRLGRFEIGRTDGAGPGAGALSLRGSSCPGRPSSGAEARSFALGSRGAASVGSTANNLAELR